MNKLAILLITVLMMFCDYSKGQTVTGQVTWECILKRKSPDEGVISMKAKIPQGWHMYALGNNAKSPIKMNFKFQLDKSYELVGKVSQPTPRAKFEKVLGIPVTYFENDVEFSQRVKIKGKNSTIRGAIEFMQCSDEICIPPQEFGFTLKIFSL